MGRMVVLCFLGSLCENIDNFGIVVRVSLRLREKVSVLSKVESNE